MKRTFVLTLAALAAAALFAGLVHAVLVTTHVSEPAATTVYGLTPRRLWATTVALLALVGVIIGGLVPWIRDVSHNSRAGRPVWRRCSSLAYAQYARSSRLASRAPRSGTYARHHESRGLALRRSAGRIDTGSGRWRATLALVAGLIAVVSGGLNLAFATGGPGTGNGVVGGAAALVLGLVAMVLGALAVSRSRRTPVARLPQRKA